MSDDEKLKKLRKQFKIATHILVVDIEATGMRPGPHGIVEFAGVVRKIGSEKIEEGHEIHLFLGLDNPDGCSWGEKTLREFWNNKAHGADNKTPYELLKERSKDMKVSSGEEAACAFVKWANRVRDELGPDADLIITFDTAGFDWAFLSILLAKHSGACGVENLNFLFGSDYKSVRDLSSLYFGLGGYIGNFGSEQAALNGLGLPPEFPMWILDLPYTHNPLDDARSTSAKASFLLETAHKQFEQRMMAQEYMKTRRETIENKLLDQAKKRAASTDVVLQPTKLVKADDSSE